MTTDSVACASAILGQLLAQGVTDLVLCPGSRSAPLALVAAAAAREGKLRLHVRVDERSAAFLALGLAKGAGRCVPVVTTSGTAVANLLPAVLEAHHSGVPLLVVSADRPGALVGFGANQTTEQLGLFEGFTRYRGRVSSGAPRASWAAQAARAFLAATGAASGHPGPSHLNVELGLPLVDAVVPAPVPGRPVVVADPAEPVPLQLPGTPRTLVVCGDAPVAVGRTAADLAETAGLPLLAEPSSNARLGANALAAGRLLLAGELGAQVERVLVFGRPNLSRPVATLLARPDVEVVVVSRTPDFVDPGWTAAIVAGALGVEPGSAAWLAAWQEADAARSAHLADVIAAPPGAGFLTGPQLAALVVATTASDDVLCLGNSNPIRDADLAPVVAAPAPVFANRGLAGIDGSLATAVGVALGTGRPATLLVGDLAFVHDCGALAIGPGEPRPQLRVVVADDAGGSIFATLEYGDPQFADAFERVFATPTGVDPVALAAGLGVPATRLRDAGEVEAALAEPITGLEVLVVEIDRAGRADLTARL